MSASPPLVASLLAALYFLSAGAQGIVTAYAAAPDVDKTVYTAATALTTALLTAPFLLLAIRTTPEGFAWIARSDFWQVLLGVSLLAMSIGYVVSSYGRLRARALLHSASFAAASRLNVVFLLVLSHLLLHERRTLLDFLVISLGLFPILLAGSKGVRLSSGATGSWFDAITYIVAASVISAGLQVGHKALVAADRGLQVPPLMFIFCVNCGTALVCSVLLLFRPDPPRGVRKTLRLGGVTGAINTLSLGALTLYLVHGDASMIFPIGAMSAVLPTLVLIKKEARMTRVELAASLLTVCSAVLLIFPSWRR